MSENDPSTLKKERARARAAAWRKAYREARRTELAAKQRARHAANPDVQRNGNLKRAYGAPLSKVRAPRQISEMTDERIRIWSFLVLSLGKERWVTHEQIALGAQVAMRTARDNALTLFQHGILDRVERTPHRYRISPQAKKQGLYQRLQQAKEMSDEEAGEGAP